MWNIEDKVVMVTGANSGIGKAAATALAQRGAHVLMVCRSEERGEAARVEIMGKTGSQKVELLLCDLASQQQIRTVADQVNTTYDQLDVLVNNAAIVPRKRHVTPDGMELQLAVNHLAPFLLTNLLLDKLKAAADEAGEARIITVSSNAHQFVSDGINFDDLQSKQVYRAFRTYAQTKLMNILHVRELTHRLEGTGVTANAVHPGAVNTNFARDAPAIVSTIFGWLARSPEKGAETVVYLAASPEVSGTSGQYFSDKAVARTSEAARSSESAARLWEVSEALTGETQEG